MTKAKAPVELVVNIPQPTTNVSINETAPVLTKYEHVWLTAWTAVIQGDPKVNDGKVPVNWADNCLKAFKERFP